MKTGFLYTTPNDQIYSGKRSRFSSLPVVSSRYELYPLPASSQNKPGGRSRRSTTRTTVAKAATTNNPAQNARIRRKLAARSRQVEEPRLARCLGSGHTRQAMLTLGTLTLGPVPRIAAPMTDTDVRTRRDVVRRYADISELRIDQFARHDAAYVLDVCRAARELGLPLIATVRAVDEGGALALDDAKRLELFKAVVPLVAAVDIE